MSAVLRTTQSERSRGFLPVKRSLVEKLDIDPAGLKDEQFQSERPTLAKRAPFALATITFCIGVAVTLAWQSHGDAARKAIAGSFPQLGGLTPQAGPVTQNTPDIVATATSGEQQQLNAMSLNLDEVRQSIDRIATSIAATQERVTQSVDRNAASQERIARIVDQLAAGQEQMTREITKLQAIEQYILYKNAESPPPAPAPPRSRAPRPSQAPTAPTSPRNP